ncbi:HAMP domain-containing sensor histidine kinase [Marinobacter sp. chi1]|uniref:histidine kinase n=1 Tax=Marinobacter suaedae TaxID=3057675 RepID=A0ABT8VYH5_9GAMM|nr:HAMP domain-containing sensor histidine kinase [Marinobacter sp. chi1]MDO3721051.1 HAMP domain-containing sensor histidine kinase [Marinobacter sp. chi1]
MDTQVIRSQQAAGFRRLHFSQELEPRYQEFRASVVRDRARLVSAAGLMLFSSFILADLLLLPAELASVTIAIRLWLTLPTITVVWWLSFCQKPANILFEHLYTLAYLIGGLSVVAIIAAARVRDFPLPYEGMLLILMFGYFAMGLPFFAVSIASALIIAAYVAAELATGHPVTPLLVNLFFILTANTIGMVGSWLSEYRHRAHFLDQKLIELLHQSAKEESEQKGRLISVASHDLRQPLNVIALMLDNLSQARLSATHLSLIQRLQRTVGHFRQLLSNVLDVSRLHEGMVCPQNEGFTLTPLIGQLIDLTVDQAAIHRITLEQDTIPANLRVHADPDLLLRVLQNLVFNAIDHSGGRNIRVSANQRGDTVRIEISDDGGGLDDRIKPDVFKPYIRGEHGPDHPAGLGLGLAIVQQLTQMMGGRCGVRSYPTQGSSFWVELAVAPPPDETAATADAAGDVPLRSNPSAVPD